MLPSMERLLQALRSLYIACFTSLNPQELGTVVLPNSQMRKLRFSHWIYAQFCWLQSSEVFFFFPPFNLPGVLVVACGIFHLRCRKWDL